MGETLKRRTKPAGDGDEQLLDGIVNSSRDLVKDMGDIVWAMNPRRDYLGDLTARLRAFGSDLLEPRKVRWRLETPDSGLERWLAPDVRRQVFLILKEAIHNVSKHSNAGSVVLRLWIRNRVLHAELHDDGFWPAGTACEGTGLASMRERTERLGGTFALSENAQRGTTVCVTVPLGGRHDHALAYHPPL
jgi:signal transduction histidine kinase